MKSSDYKSDWFIFNREKPLYETHIDHIKDEAIEKAKIRRIRAHDLRHSHASNLISEGIRFTAVSRRSVHSNKDIALIVYTLLLYG